MRRLPIRNRTRLFLLVVLVVALAAAGCAAGANPRLDTASQAGIVAGFWRGLWHGLIAPVTFVISLFDPGIRVYEVHNIGGWYDLGFLLGMSAVFGGAGRQASVPRPRRSP